MSSPTFTCLTCRVIFPDVVIQREHYKCEWHRYNIKRKVAQLPPITYQVFRQIEINQQQKEQLNGANANEVLNFHCKGCSKQFANQKAFEQHNQSKKHRDVEEAKCTLSAVRQKHCLDQLQTLSVEESRQPSASNSNAETLRKEATEAGVRAVGSDGGDDDEEDWESVYGEEKEFQVNLNECLFCPHVGTSIEANLEHMSVLHSWYVPDLPYLIDPIGLLSYLKKKVGYYFLCLWCSETGKSFYSLDAVQKHMVDKGHFKMRYEAGETTLEYSDFYDYSSSYPDADGADKDAEIDEINEINEIGRGDWEMVCPSGAVIGHRSLVRYYKQNLKPILDVQQQTRRKYILDKMVSQYKRLGWTGTSGPAAVQKAKDIRFIQRIQKKRYLALGMTGNQVLQKHYKRQDFLFG